MATNFNDLFNEALQVSDKRNKIFNELIKSTKEEILPQFIKALGELDYYSTTIRTNSMTVQNQECEEIEHSPFEIEKVYMIRIYTSGEIKELLYDNEKDVFIESNHYTYNIENLPLIKSGIIEFNKKLNSKLSELIEKRKNENVIVEEILESKQLTN